MLKATQGLIDVDERRAPVEHGGLDQRHELRLVAGEAARHEGGAELQRHAHHVDRRIVLTTPFLLFEPLSAVAENWPLVRP